MSRLHREPAMFKPRKTRSTRKDTANLEPCPRITRIDQTKDNGLGFGNYPRKFAQFAGQNPAGSPFVYFVVNGTSRPRFKWRPSRPPRARAFRPFPAVKSW